MTLLQARFSRLFRNKLSVLLFGCVSGLSSQKDIRGDTYFQEFEAIPIGTLLIKIVIISNEKSVTRFESTISLARKLTSDFLFIGNCIIKEALVNFLVILIENVPKRMILCVRENPD